MSGFNKYFRALLVRGYIWKFTIIHDYYYIMYISYTELYIYYTRRRTQQLNSWSRKMRQVLSIFVSISVLFYLVQTRTDIYVCFYIYLSSYVYICISHSHPLFCDRFSNIQCAFQYSIQSSVLYIIVIYITCCLFLCLYLFTLLGYTFYIILLSFRSPTVLDMQDVCHLISY